LTTLPFLTAALAEHADHFCAARAGVVGDDEHGFHLDHDLEECEI
jgi:hypothetical protein